MDKRPIDAMNRLLCKVDDLSIAEGGPILSSLVVHGEDRRVSDAFWDTVKKHNLRMEGETDADCLFRMREDATKRYKKFN